MESRGKYRELIAWQKAYGLALVVHRLTQTFPREERYELGQQMRRAAISVPSNIAEGWGRGTTADYVRFLGMARGSLYELQTQLLMTKDLDYVLPDHDAFSIIDEVERLLNGLIRSLKEKLANP